MTSPSDIRGYAINLPRRRDRRDWLSQSLPSDLPFTFTSDWDDQYDGAELSRTIIEAAGMRLFPWRIESENPWWNRPLKLGEIGCTLAHLACWRHAASTSTEPFILVLEDDAILSLNFLGDLIVGLDHLTQTAGFDLLYLGRYPLEPSQPAMPGFVSPGYSHCTFAYALSRRALDVLLATRLERALVPIDEFLPALYLDHPRADLRARFPRQLTALAFDPALVQQRPKDEAGSDTEDSDFVG